MDKNNSKKIKIKKISISKNFHKENFSQSSRNTINKVLIPFNRIKSSKEIKIKNKFNFSDPFKQKIFNKIRKSKSRQSIFSKSQYLFYGKDEINLRSNNALKSTIEMENKFYIRSKKGIKPEYQSDSLLKILAKDPTKVLQKIILNYGGLLKNKNRENIKDGGGAENLEDIMKKEKLNHNYNLDLRKKKKLSHTFIISKPSKFLHSNRNKNRLSFFIPNIPSSSQSKTIMSNSFSNINDFKNEKEVNYENIAKHNINIIKKILKNRMKKNSKMLSDSLINLGDDNLPYEPINEIISNRKIGQNIYMNAANLTRLIKVSKTVRSGFYEDDDINNIKTLKNYYKNPENAFKYFKYNNIPKSVKTNHFSRSTINRYNQYQGNYFGVPV